MASITELRSSIKQHFLRRTSLSHIFFMLLIHRVSLAQSTNESVSSGEKLRMQQAGRTNSACEKEEMVAPVGTNQKPGRSCDFVKFHTIAKVFGVEKNLLLEKNYCGEKHIRLLAKGTNSGVVQIISKGTYCVSVNSVPFYEYLIPAPAHIIDPRTPEPATIEADYGSFEFQASWYYKRGPDGKIIVIDPLIPGESLKFQKVRNSNLFTVKRLDFNINPVRRDNRFSVLLEFGTNSNRNNPVVVTASPVGAGVPLEANQGDKYFVVGPSLDLEVGD